MTEHVNLSSHANVHRTVSPTHGTILDTKTPVQQLRSLALDVLETVAQVCQTTVSALTQQTETWWTTIGPLQGTINPRARKWFPLLYCSGLQFITVISAIRHRRQMQAGSLGSELASLLTPAKLLMLQRPWLQHMTLQLKREQNLSGPTWLPQDNSEVVSLSQAAHLSAAASSNHLALAALMAFCTGRRICDILRIERAYVFLQHVLGPSIVLVVHKTAPTRGPLTVFLPQALVELVRLRMLATQGQKYLFCNAVGTGATCDWTKQEKLLKKTFFPKTDLRGLRRGGLCTAAQAASREEDMLMMSDHGNLRGLQTYLGGGLMSIPRRNIQVHLGDHIAQQIQQVAGQPGPV